MSALPPKADVGGFTGIYYFSNCFLNARSRLICHAIQDYQQRHEAERVRGMIVTTSQSSPDARNLAIRHDIQLLDGPALADLCAAENAREN